MEYLAIAALLGLAAAVEKPEATPPYNAWESVKDGAADGKYERVITPHFSADSDDIFMRSMIKKYAVEERTGKFWMTQSTTLGAAKEVLATHKGLSGDALSAYLDTYFKKAWDHFDVNQSGKIEVIKSPQFM